MRVSVPAAQAPQRRAIPWLGLNRGKVRAQIPPARARGRSRKTIRIARRIASFEADLLRTAIIVFIRSASKEAIRRAIRIVFRERPLALGGGICARTFSPFKPSHGMAIRCGAWAAGTETRSGASGVAADRTGPRAFHWDYHWLSSGNWRGSNVGL